jgi:hypothetical protein
MDFEQYNIDADDYEFFSSLPDDEKILFIYDLICDSYYGIGSTQSFSADIESFDDYVHSLISDNIDHSAPANIIFINSFVIINSNSKKHMNHAIQALVTDGLMLRTYKISEKTKQVLKHQKFFRVFEITDRNNKIHLN